MPSPWLATLTHSPNTDNCAMEEGKVPGTARI